jgi:hypothetical protein
MGRGASQNYAADEVTFAPNSRGPELEPTEKLAKAQWSVGLSKARGLGDQDLVRQIVKHCNLPEPTPDTAAKIANEVVLDQRGTLSSQDLAAAILVALAVSE